MTVHSSMTRKRAKSNAGLFDELVVDLFAGGGGASLGIERALGRSVDLAVNHNPIAVAMHARNHPHTRHLRADVFEVDPFDATCGRPVGLLWASPDCTQFSRAKGGKPIRDAKKKLRCLAWIVVRWAAKVRPRVILLENVREFETWGPLGDDDKPCPKRKGKTFKRWVGCLKSLGYAVEWRTLNAADYGAPTHRRRLFMVARRDGEPIVWPEPTHGPGRRSYRTAAECIDWSLPCPSIFLTKEEGRAVGCNRPLAPKTMRRIAMGIKRFVLENPKPFIVKINHGGDEFRGQSIDRPLSTVTGSHGHGIITPIITAQYGEAPHQETRGQVVNQPIRTITPRAGGGFSVVAPHLSQYFGGRVGKLATDPLPTITACDHNAVVAPTLVQYNQEQSNDEVRGQSPNVPLNTITPEPRFALAAANLIQMHNGSSWSVADEPLRTVLAGANHHALSVANLGDGDRQPEVRAFLMKYFGNGTGQGLDDSLHTITARDRFGLVTVEGRDYAIADIGLRMLTPRELFRAQGFPDDYVIDPIINGKRLPKTGQVRMCGNSVSPPVSEALVRANFADEAAPARAPRKRKAVLV